ncbi:MAG: hypothetical protein EBT07_17045 [Actinobacteria bacterium]|nr:hypothetical protein [Actinomycetota bacterium]
MTTANNVKLIKMLSDRYKFDADDAIEYVKTASKKGRPKKEIEVEHAKDLFDKILEDAGEPPLEKDPSLYKKFEKAPEKVNKTAEKEAKKLEKEKKAAEKAAEKEKKAAEKEAKKLEKEKKAAEKEAKKLEKEKKASEKTSKKEVKPVVAPSPPVKTVTQVESSDDDSSDEEDEEEEELKPEEKELVVIKYTPIEELVIDESSDVEIDEDVNKIVQSVIKAKMAKCEAKKESDDESDDSDEEEEEEEEEEEVVKVKRVKINDKDYLKSNNNVLYDVDTNDAIGVWDENKQEIILNELDEDSYVEEDNNEESEDEESK